MKPTYDKRRKSIAVTRKIKSERKVEMLQCELKLLKQRHERRMRQIEELCVKANLEGANEDHIAPIYWISLIKP
jgi:hypothetical protein